MNKKAQGFTIVELLIVIVVIAILAAISIAAYTNIQQRAKNTAIINAASQSLKMIQAYIAANGTYPLASDGAFCMTVDSECQTDSNSDSKTSSSTTFNTRMATIGTLPKSVPAEGGRLYGVSYSYYFANRFNTEPRPAYIRYYLIGVNQQCGLPGVMAYSAPVTYVTSTTGYSSDNTTLNKTTCLISIPGPAHS